MDLLWLFHLVDQVCYFQRIQLVSYWHLPLHLKDRVLHKYHKKHQSKQGLQHVIAPYEPSIQTISPRRIYWQILATTAWRPFIPQELKFSPVENLSKKEVQGNLKYFLGIFACISKNSIAEV